MPAPAVLRDVFNGYRAHHGEEDDGFVFEDETSGAPISRLEVLVYRPTTRSDTTSFVTIGMATNEMPALPGPGGGGRAELHFERRGRLARADENAVGIQLANLAVYPFLTGEQLNWGHMISLNGEFPTFPGCRAVFLVGPLTDNGLDYLHTTAGSVRIVNVIPITEAERAQGRALPPLDFAQSLLKQRDIFTEP